MEEASAVRPVDCEVDDRRRIAALRAPPVRDPDRAVAATRGAVCVEDYESLEDLIASETGERR
jgi:hypothetical protein